MIPQALPLVNGESRAHHELLGCVRTTVVTGRLVLWRQRGLQRQVGRPGRNADEWEVISRGKVLIIPWSSLFSWEMGSSLWSSCISSSNWMGVPDATAERIGSWWKAVSLDNPRGISSALLKKCLGHHSPSCPCWVIAKVYLCCLLHGLFFIISILKVLPISTRVSWRTEMNVYFLLLRRGLNWIKFVSHCCSSLWLFQ